MKDGSTGTGPFLFWYDNDKGPKVGFSVARYPEIPSLISLET